MFNCFAACEMSLEYVQYIKKHCCLGRNVLMIFPSADNPSISARLQNVVVYFNVKNNCKKYFTWEAKLHKI